MAMLRMLAIKARIMNVCMCNANMCYNNVKYFVRIKFHFY